MLSSGGVAAIDDVVAPESLSLTTDAAEAAARVKQACNELRENQDERFPSVATVSVLSS